MTQAKASGHGGRRRGAGAPRSRLPREVLDAIGPPPIDDPLRMIRWWSKLLGQLTWLRLQGRVSPGLVEDVRYLANTAKALVPEDLRAEVDRLLREQAVAKANSGRAAGAATEPAIGAMAALQGDPR